jgi:Raf kinase inhibitor-like YbhB/YbcL family protein
MLLLLLAASMLHKTDVSLTSPVFTNQGDIPVKYSCEGEGVNPPLVIGEVPKGTKTLALLVDDPDAPKKTFDHWVVYNISPTNAIRENSKPGTEGKNGKGQIGYTGPCPPSGQHHYYFTVYALDTRLDLKAPTKDEVIKAMDGHILGSGVLIGLYQKTK